MKNYELIILLDGAITPAKKKSFQTKLEKLIETFKGKIGKINNWGKIELAYPIKKNKTGNFILFPLELEPQAAKQVDTKLRLDNEIIRYLLVRS